MDRKAQEAVNAIEEMADRIDRLEETLLDRNRQIEYLEERVHELTHLN